MKKIIALIVCAAMISVTTAGCGGTGENNETASNVVKVFNWGEMIGEDVIRNFEDEYDAKVIYETYDSNEMMYAKLQAGDKYDVLVPSDYMIERLLNENALMPLDKSLITNIDNLADEVKGLPYDPDLTYSVPYFYGSVGIVYNKNNVPKELIEEQGWDILKNTDYKGKIFMYDSERDSFMIALKALGYSMNTDNEDEIQQAYEWLLDLNNTMEPIYVMDEVIDSMANSVKDLAVVYSGDASYILAQNEDMGFCEPKQGTNIFCDSMVIPANSENPELAHKFIDYVLTYDASYDNTYTVGYTSPNKQVRDDISSEGGEYYEIESYIPRSGYEKDEVFHDNAVIREQLSNLWIKVKSSEE